MKFRLREGFKLFRSQDEAISYECRGPASGVTPRAVGGDVVDFKLQELEDMRSQGSLGKLEPVDAEAIAHFGSTKPIISRRITNPELFVRPAPENEHV